LRRAEQQTKDLQWDAAKILLDSDPARPAMRTVQASGDQLVTDLRHSQSHAEDLRDTLRQARRHLEHAAPLVAELTGATQDPEHAAAAAMLATRLERLASSSSWPPPWPNAPAPASSRPTAPWRPVSRRPVTAAPRRSTSSGASTGGSSTPPENSPTPAPAPPTAPS